MKTKTSLGIAFIEGSLHVAAYKKSQLLFYEKIFLRETVTPSVSQRIAHQLKGSQKPEVVLILPRAEILQKELALSAASTDLKLELETQIAKALPYSLSEMAYGFSLNDKTENFQGLLYAIPQKKLFHILSFLENLGFVPDEIITEDQCLVWSILNMKETNTLLLDDNEERTLAVAVKSNRLVFSRAYPKQGTSIFSSEEIYQELSLALMEINFRPKNIFLTEAWSSEKLADMTKYFNLPYFKMAVPEGMPAVLQGVWQWEQREKISLLPVEKKLQRWKTQFVKTLRQALVALSFYGLSLVVAFLLYRASQEKLFEQLSQDASILQTSTLETLKKEEGVKRFREAQESKIHVLNFMKEIAEVWPGTVALKEWSMDRKGIVLKGESSSHALLSETVRALEKISSVKQVKLVHSQFRKKLNHEYLDFELSGLWKKA